MSKLAAIEQQIRDLTVDEFDAFRAWFVEFDHEQWDRQIALDAATGKLDKFSGDAMAEFNAGQCKPL